MCQAYEARRHPLSLVMLDFRDAFKITDGLSKSLSNKNRKVSISLKQVIQMFQNNKVIKTCVYTKLQPDELDIFDRIENLNITGETLNFQKNIFPNLLSMGSIS